MKIVAVIMLLTGAAIGAGGALEFVYFGPGTRQFWAGVIATPAGILFTVVGILLWRERRGVRRFVIATGLVMLTATIAATALDVMGPLATLTGVVGGLAPLIWAWRDRAVTV